MSFTGNDSGSSEHRSVTFIFTHATLENNWEIAAKTLAEEGIHLTVISQMQGVDWDSFIATTLLKSSASYVEVTNHFGRFEQIIDAAHQLEYALPAGLETEAAWHEEIDRDAQLLVAAYLKSGTASDLANASRYLLYKSGNIDSAPPNPSKPVLSGIYHPSSATLWQDAITYLSWADARDSVPMSSESLTPVCLDRERSVVALIFDRNSWLNGELSLVDRAVLHLERAGMLPVAMFCD